MIGIGVIGYGYWGPNLVRNFSEAPGSVVRVVSDLHRERLEKVLIRYPGIKTTTLYKDLINDPQVDAVAIATPVSTHFDLAMMALQAGKHVFLEKPITSSSDQAIQLIDEAERRNLVLLVDHSFVYTGAVRKIRELITNKELGEIYYYDSVRINLGFFQHDVDVVWDLAVHDLAILNFILPFQPRAVSATGVKHFSFGLINIAYMTLFFDNSLIAHIHVNWISPVKIRHTLIGGSQKMIVYNDVEPSDKIKVYDKGIDFLNTPENSYQIRSINYRTGDVWAPKLDGTEALQTETRHFLACIEGKEKLITDGYAGLQVVRVLEAASLSIEKEGECTNLRGKI